MTEQAITLSRILSKAYWPKENDIGQSANRGSGNAAVDQMTLGQLYTFFSEVNCGPTYCMVAERVKELLDKFPPAIADKRQQAVAAMEAAKRAFLELQNAVELETF